MNVTSPRNLLRESRRALTVAIGLIAISGSPVRAAQSYSLTHVFQADGVTTDGKQPLSNITADSNNNLFGTTQKGGPYGG